MNINDLKIIFYPDPVLRQVAAPVEKIDDEITKLAEKMIDLMVEARGIGLAAPQVALPLRLFVKSLNSTRQDAQVFINPQISAQQGLSELEEGCLSLPGVHVKVRRPATCVITAQDLRGERISFETSELEAAVVQHENDHLDGHLIIDKTSSLDLIACRKVLKQLERDYSH